MSKWIRSTHEVAVRKVSNLPNQNSHRKENLISHQAQRFILSLPSQKNHAVKFSTF